MRTNRPIIIATFLLLLLGSGAVLHHVFRIPLERGGAYPPYSSHRPDPLGTQVLFEALRAQPNLDVARNERNLMMLREGPDTTLLLAGAIPSPDPVRVLEHLEQFMENGGRIVIALNPFERPLFATRPRDADSEDRDPVREGRQRERIRRLLDRLDSDEPEEILERDEEDGDEADDDPVAALPFQDAGRRWGYRLRISETGREQAPGEEVFEVTRASEDARDFLEWAQLPEAVRWHSPHYFAELEDDWRTVYRRGDRPVFIERDWGEGSLVIAADSYFLSNEAMATNRYPHLIAWMLGGNSRILFNETHLGISRDPGLSNLMREYRLHLAILSLLVLALLFLWKNMSTLTPRHGAAHAAASTGAELGRAASAGLVNLLRRSVPRARVLGVCLDLWHQEHLRERVLAPETEQRLRELAAQAPKEGEAAVAARYNAMVEALKERK